MSWDIQALFRHHAGGILRSLQRRGFNEETAADLTQDTFVQVLSHPPSTSTHNHNPKAYIYKISRNLGINHQKREALLTMIDIDSELGSSIADPRPTPDRLLYSKQCLLQTHDALAELPERTRKAFELHRLEGLTMAEIAQELGISTTRAWALIRDAYQHLIRHVPIP